MQNTDKNKMKQYQWIQHFKSELGNFEKAYAKQPRTEGPLLFALKRQIISEQEYLKWAQIHFQLPKVRSEYFEKQELPLATWSELHEKFTWSQECLPIGVWDGHVIVATIDPESYNLQSFTNNQISAIVCLAETNAMATWYEKFESTKNSLSTKNNLQELGSDSQIPTPPTTNIESLELADEPVQLETTESLNELSSESPEGFDSPLNPTEINKPEGIELFDDASTKIDLDFSSLTVGGTQEPAATTQTATTPAAPVITTTAASAAEVISLEKRKTEIQAKQTPSNIKNSNFSRWPFDYVKSESKKVFEELKPTFDRSILLGISHDSQSFQAICWDELLSPKNSDEVIQLNTPSIFNIAFQTHKPFHGPVSPCDVNDRFFANWNNSTTPEIATVVPVMLNDQFLGMIIGFTNNTGYNKHSLQKFEGIVANFAQGLSKAS